MPTPNQTPPAAAEAASSASSATTIWSTPAKTARTAAKQLWRAGTPFSSKRHQICFSRLRGSRRNKISSHRRTISATTRSTTLRLARRHAAGCAELRLRSEFRRRHVCRNGRIASASASLTRRNFAWGSLACENFTRGELHQRDHHLHQRPHQSQRRRSRLHQDQRQHLLLRHKGQLKKPPDTLGAHLSTPQRELKISKARRRWTTALQFIL